MQKNEIFTGKVIDYTHDGLGIVKIDNFPIFIEDVIEGEEVEFKIIKLKKNLCYIFYILTPITLILLTNSRFCILLVSFSIFV